jgi:hypothetical protein
VEWLKLCLASSEFSGSLIKPLLQTIDAGLSFGGIRASLLPSGVLQSWQIHRQEDGRLPYIGYAYRAGVRLFPSSRPQQLKSRRDIAIRNGGVFVDIGESAICLLLETPDRIRRTECVPTSAISFIPQAIQKLRLSVLGMFLQGTALNEAPAPFVAARWLLDLRETAMPPDNSDSLNEFEMALRQAWETLRDRTESRKDLIPSANRLKGHDRQDHMSSDVEGKELEKSASVASGSQHDS